MQSISPIGAFWTRFVAIFGFRPRAKFGSFRINPKIFVLPGLGAENTGKIADEESAYKEIRVQRMFRGHFLENPRKILCTPCFKILSLAAGSTHA